MAKYRTTPSDSPDMPGGIPYIIANEAAERFSFYGMKAALAIFLANYLGVLGGQDMSETKATSYVAFFTGAVYFTPLIGALIADAFFGKYRTIMTLSVVYCLGHFCLAFMGVGGVVELWLLAGLGLIAIGAGGIKPCVSAHVGDQFGKNSQHLLTKVFNFFYLSINFGAVISNILIPWILKWHGPHLAFGIPGILMALATVFFWMGRHKFIHVPAEGDSFVKELKSREGRNAILKLTPLILFIAMFWCLFDQTASTLVFQAEKMDRNIFGIEVLPSQIQAFNPFLILVLIPVFTFLLYPAIDRFLPFTPLRKIGTGMFVMIGSFVVVALAQEAIDAGKTPHVGWQLLAYFILTSAEIMISIVGLEFFYTQAPRRMKSLMMGIFLLSVFIGNSFTGIVNSWIEIPSVEFAEDGTHVGHDGKPGTADDLVKTEGRIESAAAEQLRTVAARVEAAFEENGEFPASLDGLPTDPWGNAVRYKRPHSGEARITSDGPDGEAGTLWDLGIKLTKKEDEAAEGTWLYEKKVELGQLGGGGEGGSPLNTSYTAGGGSKLEGAAYFWFFTRLMAITAILFVPYALLYRPRTYLQGGGDDETPEEEFEEEKESVAELR